MTPSVRRSFGSLRRLMPCMSKPLTEICPDVGLSSPVISLMIVVLPEPDGPTRNTNSPSLIVKLIPLRAAASVFP